MLIRWTNSFMHLIVQMLIQLFVHGKLTTASNEGTFIQNFLENIRKKCFLGTICIVMYIAYSNLQLQYIVLPISK